MYRWMPKNGMCALNMNRVTMITWGGLILQYRRKYKKFSYQNVPSLDTFSSLFLSINFYSVQQRMKMSENVQMKQILLSADLAVGTYRNPTPIPSTHDRPAMPNFH
jgi:hypothetical protein